MTTPRWATEWLTTLTRSRDKAREHGHDVSRISIGYWDGLVKVCDDDGQYCVWLGQAGATCHASDGCPSRALEAVFYHRCT